MHLRVVVACVAFTVGCKGHDKGNAPSSKTGSGAATSAPSSAPTLGTIAEVSGAAQVKRGAAADWEPLAKGSQLHRGDSIRTGEESFIRVKIDGGYLDLAEPTTVTLGDSLIVGQGSFVAVLDPGGKPLVVQAADGSEAHIAAPAGAAMPSTFRVSPAADKSLDIAALKGDVAVKTQTGERPIAAGKATRIAKQAATEPVSLIAFPKSIAPGIDARFHFVADKPVDLQWDAVKGATGYRVQIARDTEFHQLVLTVEAASVAAQFVPTAAGMYAWRVAARDSADRLGEYGFGRRLYFEQDPPKDLLLTPPAGAKIGFSDSYPKVEFSWQSLGDSSEYKLVVGRGAAPAKDPVVTIPTTGQKVEVATLREGTYHWGVYAVVDGREEPIFMTPRELTIRKQRVKAHTENLWNEKP